jgi:5-methylcytosine-specific restriction endonuclease McrA
MAKPCKVCESTWHTAFRCPYKPRKGLKVLGKQGSAWKNTRNLWFEHNPPDENGLYYCYICGKPLIRGKPYSGVGRITLDHLISRSRNPSLRNSFTNLAPCCWSCNTKKGSLSVKEYHDKVYGNA